MKKYCYLALTIIFTCFIWIGCSNSIITNNNVNTSWVFVANEGTMGASNGTISMIDDFGNVYTTGFIGDVVQSLEVYNNKLFVIVTDDHKMLMYNIDPEGISLEKEFITNSSMPREMVIVNDKIYFTNLETQDVKIIDILNKQLEETTISIDGRPEDIIFDGIYIWVSIPEISKWDKNQGTKVAKIDPNSNEIIEYIEVGRGPQSLILHNDNIFVSRTYYDDNWNPQHGATKIGTEIIKNNYGSGAPCGGSIISHANKVYRSQNWIPDNEEGIVPLDIDNNLDFISLEKIGNYQSPIIIYHMENINGKIYFTLTDFASINLLKILDNYNNEIATYEVGINPGDLAYWKKLLE